MINIMEIQNLTKRLDGFQLEGVTFSVPAGFIMGLIGPNGAGKTTMIKLVLGMLRKDDGEIRILGEQVQDGATAKVREEIGVVMDRPYYAEDWTVSQVEKAISHFYSRWDRAAYQHYCSRFQLLMYKQVKELSKGMKMKLQIAVALSHDPRLLILDEPTSGLDPVARDELLEILREFIIDENKVVLFSTHITSDVEKISDYITFVQEGKIIYTGRTDAFLERYALVKGGIGDLNFEQKKYMIGYREHSSGFDGLIDTNHLKNMPKSILIEPAAIDDIFIRINKGGAGNA